MALTEVAARPTDQDTDDLDLVAAVRAGDERAFELLYLRYQSQIGSYVRGMVRDHGRAEDITQEVFFSALRRIRDTEREIVFKPWVYEIAKNACIDAFRRSRHTNEVSFDADDALGAGDHDRLAGMGATPDAAIDTKVALENLRGAFGGLSAAHHQILVMRELEGLSYRDIGERLGMSRPAVESTLFRARRRLGEEYDELVSGKRCLRVRAIVDRVGRSAGVRDQRRMDRHISHCQPCRRYALAAGVDLEARPALRPAAARIAALLPLPAILRRRGDVDAAGQLLGSQSRQATITQWSANVVAGVDPGTVVGWSKAVVTAAMVAVAGVGAGAAVSERDALRQLVSGAPAAGFGARTSAAGGTSGPRLHEGDAGAQPAGGAGARSRAGGSLAGLTAAVGQRPHHGGHGPPPIKGGRRPSGAAGGDSGANPTPPGPAQHSANRPTPPGPAQHSANRPTPPGPAQHSANRPTPPGPAQHSANRPNPLGPVDDPLDGAVGHLPGAGNGGSATTDGEGPAADDAGTDQDVSRGAGSTHSRGNDTAQAATRQPLADVVTHVAPGRAGAVDTALPGS